VGLLGSSDFAGMFIGAALAWIAVANFGRRWFAFSGLPPRQW